MIVKYSTYDQRLADNLLCITWIIKWGLIYSYSSMLNIVVGTVVQLRCVGNVPFGVKVFVMR